MRFALVAAGLLTLALLAAPGATAVPEPVDCDPGALVEVCFIVCVTEPCDPFYVCLNDGIVEPCFTP